MNELETAKVVAKEAGKIAMSLYKGNNLDTRQKAENGSSPITKADLASEKVILKTLRKFDYGILSEETLESNNRLKKEKVWIIDPLDGTSDFIQKTDEFAIAIGLVKNNKPILGVVYQPPRDKLYFAEKGKGAWLKIGEEEPRKLKVSKKEDFNNMLMLTSRNHLEKAEIALAKNLKIKFKKCGSAVLKMGLIAERIGDLYINSSKGKTGEWDTCAGNIIITEAGGRITDMNGEELAYNKKNTMDMNGYIVSTGTRHNELIVELKRVCG